MTSTAPQWARVTRRMLRGLTSQLAWFWIVCLFFGTAAIVVLDRYAEIAFSVMSLIRYGAIWHPFATALIIVGTMLNVHVAAGQTRRSFLIASLVTATVYGVASGAVMTAVLAVERQVYAAQGWPHVSTGANALPEPAGAALAAYSLAFVAGGISGALVGFSYYRWGVWATAALPVTALPAALATGLDPSAIALAVIAALTAAAVLGSYLLARHIPIRKPLEAS